MKFMEEPLYDREVTRAAIHELAGALLYRVRRIYGITTMTPALEAMLEDIIEHGPASDYLNDGGSKTASSDGTGSPQAARYLRPEDRCDASSVDYYSGLWRNDRNGEEVRAIGPSPLNSEASRCIVIRPAERDFTSVPADSVVDRHLYWDSWRRL